MSVNYPQRIQCPLCHKPVDVDHGSGKVAPHTVVVQQLSSDQRGYVNITYTCPLDAHTGEWQTVGRG